MTEVRTTAEQESRALRAVLFALAVLAQLLLPAIVLRAEASAGELCVTRSNASGPQDSKSHAHDLQCAHCSLHHCTPYVPPSTEALSVAPAVADAASLAISADFGAPLRRAQPPPTGPPSL